MKTIDVDLSSGSADWSALNDYAKSGKSLLKAFDQQASDICGSLTWSLAKKAIGYGHLLLGRVFGDEVDQIAQIFNLSSCEIIAANVAYDGSHVGCSTFVISGSEGPLHARNLDWPFPRGLLKKHVLIQRMLNAPYGDYAMVGWPGVFGVLTAIGKRRFSVSVNRVSNSQDTNTSLLSRAVQGYWPVTWALRRAMDECRDFDAAVRFLKRVPLLSPVLFTIAGTRRSEYLVIERDPDGWAVRNANSDKVICATNHYSSDPFWDENVDIEGFDTLERCEFLESRLKNAGRINTTTAFRILSSNQLLYSDTQHQVIMSPKTGCLVARVPGETSVRVTL